MAIHSPAARLLALAPRLDGASLTETFIVEAASPITDFADLAVGDSEVVVVSYDIADEQGAASSSTLTINGSMMRTSPCIAARSSARS